MSLTPPATPRSRRLAFRTPPPFPVLSSPHVSTPSSSSKVSPAWKAAMEIVDKAGRDLLKDKLKKRPKPIPSPALVDTPSIEQFLDVDDDPNDEYEDEGGADTSEADFGNEMEVENEDQREGGGAKGEGEVEREGEGGGEAEGEGMGGNEDADSLQQGEEDTTTTTSRNDAEGEREKKNGKKKDIDQGKEKEKPKQRFIERRAGAGAGGRGKHKGRISRTKRAGLTFPVSRVDSMLRKGALAEPKVRISVESSVFLASVLEYLVAELCELGGDVCISLKKKIITPRHIFLSISQDAEIHQLLKHVLISQSGVVPHIHPALCPPQKRKKEEDDETTSKKKKQRTE